MPDLLTLTCPTCGAKLKLKDGVHLLVCANCGNEHMVHRDGGAIYLAPIAQDVRQIRVGVDKTAAELAVVRLTKELEEIAKQVDEVKATDYTALIPTSFLEDVSSLAILAALGAAIGGVIGSHTALLVVSIVVGVVLVIWQQTTKMKRIREGQSHKDADLAPLQSLYNEKKAALERNRQVAES